MKEKSSTYDNLLTIIEQNNERFELVAKATNDVVWDWDLVTKNMWWNDNFYSKFGFDRHTTPTDVSSWTNNLHPEDLERANNNLHESIHKKNNYWTEEYRFIKADGSIVYILDRGYILYNKEHEPIRMVGCMVDITAKKLKEDALLLSSLKFKHIAENLPIAIGSYNENQETHFINKKFTEVLGYTIEDLPNAEEWLKKFTGPKESQPQRIKEWVDAVAAYKSGKINSSPAFEKEIICKNGKAKVFQLNFSVDDQIVYTLFTDITEKKKAEKDLQQSNEQLRNFASYLQSIREEERKNISLEIHDQLGQMITGIKMDISWLQKNIGEQSIVVRNKFNETLELINETAKTIRRISAELRPSMLDDIGLAATIQWQGQDFQKRTSILFEFNNDITNEEALSTEIKTGFFRIFQEALTNIMRHSDAHQVITSLKETITEYILSIEDNGIGFNTDEKRNTLGLLGMQERAIMLNGSLTITSKATIGTQITIQIPKIPSNENTLSRRP